MTFCVVEQLATDYKENRDVMTLHMRIRAPFVIALKEKKKKPQQQRHSFIFR